MSDSTGEVMRNLVDYIIYLEHRLNHWERVHPY